MERMLNDANKIDEPANEEDQNKGDKKKKEKKPKKEKESQSIPNLEKQDSSTSKPKMVW